jgi:uncharacterized protein (DUF486 family)
MRREYEDCFGFHRLFCQHRERKVYRVDPVFRSFNLIELGRAGTDTAHRMLPPGYFERTDMPTISPQLLPVLMLFASNVFMTFAWYGHLKFKESPLPLVIMVSWGIAFFEYWLAVPANRWGSAVYSAAQLKTMQEVITLVVFAGFSVLYLKEPLGWNHALGFGLIAAGAFFIFHKWS